MLYTYVCMYVCLCKCSSTWAKQIKWIWAMKFALFIYKILVHGKFYFPALIFIYFFPCVFIWRTAYYIAESEKIAKCSYEFTRWFITRSANAQIDSQKDAVQFQRGRLPARNGNTSSILQQNVRHKIQGKIIYVYIYTIHRGIHL